ncbi:hypothetical protein AB0T83_10855 [Fluviibacterium sp. DFM31]|uniref:Uncharacterized protein n=1 Tax=Meridianimarinicoccus marinus TaxID=3231483 RepID=A0ABV3L6S4_9RHOB
MELRGQPGTSRLGDAAAEAITRNGAIWGAIPGTRLLGLSYHRDIFEKPVMSPPSDQPEFTALTVPTFIGTFRTFDVVYVQTRPPAAPIFATDVLGRLIYRTGFGGSPGGSTATLKTALTRG